MVRSSILGLFSRWSHLSRFTRRQARKALQNHTRIIRPQHAVERLEDRTLLAALSITDVSVVEGNTGTTNAVFTVTLSDPTPQTVTVGVATSGLGTATPGVDYTPLLAGVLTFAPGQTSQTISVPVNGDTLVESDETFFVNLTAAVNATIGDAEGQGTILNDDTLPTISINDVSVLEGNLGVTNAVFTISLSAASTLPVTVTATSADGTATSPTDYLPLLATTVTFAPGVTSQEVAVPVIGDATIELDETFLVNLTAPINATFSDTQGVGTILNDDPLAPPLPVPGLSINDVAVVEGNAGTTNAVFTVTLSSASAQTVTVVATSGVGTATAGVDYTPLLATTLTFAPGVTSQTVTVPVNGDTLVETNETFLVNLTLAVNAAIADSQGLGTILDDDAGPPAPLPPSLSINDVSVLEGNAGITTAVFTISLSAASTQTVTVVATSSLGTATPVVDYAPLLAAVLTFAPGETSQTVSVTVNGDTLDEIDETFFIDLTAAVNATIADAQGQGTILDDDPLAPPLPTPSLSIGDVSIVEGNAGTTNAVFTITLSDASAQTVSVVASSADGTASLLSDYVALLPTLVTFDPGVTSQTVTVPVNGDTLVEPNETFLVNLTVAVNATLGDSQATGTILNDDLLPALSINDVSVVEGNAGTTLTTFTVTLSAPSTQIVTVVATSANGTASAPTDFTALPATTLTFAPGVTSQTVSVTVNGDTAVETDETFFINLTAASNATIGDAQGQGTILNDDPTPPVITPPTISIDDVAILEGNAGATNAVFTVSLSAASPQTVTVVATSGIGTATPAVDYVPLLATLLTFAPGTTTQTISVPVNGDTLVEPDETFFVNLTAAINGTFGDAQGQGTILNDDSLPTLSINDVSVVEGNLGTTSAVFTISLSAASSLPVTVVATSANGTATAPTDYAPLLATTVTFAPGVTSQTVTVPVNGDLTIELDETFLVNLTAPINAALSDTQGIGTILNDDPLPPTLPPVSLSINDVAVVEGNAGTTNAVFTVTLSSASAQTVTVVATSGVGTATAGVDYTPLLATTLTFAPGVTSQTVTVPVNGDILVEPNETFVVDLTVAVNATLADSQGVGTILDDDAGAPAPLPPSLSINDVSVLEGNAGTTTAVFTVTLSAASASPVTVVATSGLGGTATPVVDYFPLLVTTLTFAPGETSQTVSVTVNGDTLDEIDETFLIDLTAAVNATIADPQGVGTILDDDPEPPTLPTPSLSIGDVTVVEGNAGTTNAVFTITLSAASAQTASVLVTTADGTASGLSDYVPLITLVTFNPGVTSQTVTVAVNGDTLVEPNETFLVNLTVASNATIGDGQATGTILNDDVLPALSINDISVVEGNAGATLTTFTVTLSAPSSQTVTVVATSANGTATTPTDYVALTPTVLIFAPGQTTQTVTVAVVGDTLVEPDETFFIDLTAATNATVGDAQGQGTILNDDALPTITINDVSVVEGNAGTTNAVFTVTLSAASSQTVTVVANSANGTATAPADYVPLVASTVTFAPGVTTQTVIVPVNGDTAVEANETFFVNLTAAINAAIGDAQGQGTILNDDPTPPVIPPPSISINDVAIVEGNAGTTNAVFTISLSATSTQTVTVVATSADGTATAPIDYTPLLATTVTFAPGVTSQTVSVPVNGDTAVEANETFVVNLTAAVNGTVADAQGQGTIINDDMLPSLSINDVSVVEGNAGTTSAVFTVTLSAPSSQTVTVVATSADGTATAFSDYSPLLATTVTFAPGVTSQTVTVSVNGDTTVELNETFLVNLTAAVNAGVSDTQGIGTILNDDPTPPVFPPPSVSINDVAVVEGNAGTTNAVFTLTLSAPSAQTVTVVATSANGTATAPTDYTALPATTVTFAPGVTSQTVTVSVNGDTTVEPNETFLINLTAAVNATLSDTQGVGTILDDDVGTPVPPPPSLTINDVAVVEGNAATTITAVFTVSLSAASTQTVTVVATSADGTATAPVDYSAFPATTLTFAPGVTSQTVSVTVNGDAIDELDETFLVNLTAAVNATIADSQGVGTILDDDPVPPVLPTPSISIGDVTVVEGNAGTTNAVFTLTLSAASAQTVTIVATSADGTATTPSDYAALPATVVTFNPGETSKTVTVAVNGDTAVEPNENFLVNLTAAVNATISDSQATGTIVNDDALSTLTINDVSVTEGNAGTVNATFTITLSAASSQTVTVVATSANGTATAPSDYTALPATTVTFAPGVTTQTVTVTVNGDTAVEPNETFLVNLTAAVNATLSDTQGVGTILNDDSPTTTISINDVTVLEGNFGTTNAVFTVTLSSASTQTVTVAVATANGTATAASDYTSVTTTLTFAPGETSKSVTVPITVDTVNEPTETFVVNLSGATNATIADNQGTGTITNDDLRMYRVYNRNADLHVFMTSEAEFNALRGLGYENETTGSGKFIYAGFDAIDPGTAVSVPVHRLYNPNGGQHYLTYSDGERDQLISLGWKFEKEEGNIYTTQAPGTVEVFRLYNVNTGDHLYTADVGEKDHTLSAFPGIWVQHQSLGFGYKTPAQGDSNTTDPPFTTFPATSLPAMSSEDVLEERTGTIDTADDLNLGLIASEPEYPEVVASNDSEFSEDSENLETVQSPTVSDMDEFWDTIGRELMDEGQLLDLLT